MERISGILLKHVTTLCLSFLLFACAQLTQQNFDRIQPGMSMKEVIAILGEPTSSEGANFAGLSGTAATWKSEGAEINIIFLNDKVQIKSFNKSGDRDRNSIQPKEDLEKLPLQQPDVEGD